MIDCRNLDALEAAIEPIHGWWSPESGRSLYNLVLRSKLDVLELGAWCGRSTAWIAAALEARADGHIVMSVDTWEGTPGEPEHVALIASLDGRTLRDLWRDNMQELGLYLRCDPYIETTEMAAHLISNEYDVLLIDADHSYEAVKRDWNLFAPRIPVGGHVVLDDVPSWYGPTKFHREIPKDTWKLIRYWQNQAVFRRISGTCEGPP